MNLTGITEVNEVYLKHFYDSLLGFLMFEDIHNCKTLCDVDQELDSQLYLVKIVFPHLKMDLVDSLGKRVNFLNHVIAETKLENIKRFIHVRKNMHRSIVNHLISSQLVQLLV